MPFACFFTFHPKASVLTPVTFGYDAPRSTVGAAKYHEAPQFIHSGNWWNITPEKRTKEIVLDKQVAALNSNVSGLMSMNVDPGDDGLHWVTGREDEAHNKACLENATWARGELERRGIDVPLYCTLQPSTPAAAKEWFSRAINAGFTRLCTGVSEFLRYPKHRAEGTARLLHVVNEARLLGAGTGSNLELHLSGLTSYHLLPIVAALGATSTDGSTPVQSALAYGTVFVPGKGTGIPASKLDGRIGELDWACHCPACKGKDPGDIIEAMKDGKNRVDHDLHVFTQRVAQINREILPSPAEWFRDNSGSVNSSARKAWALAIELLDL